MKKLKILIAIVVASMIVLPIAFRAYGQHSKALLDKSYAEAQVTKSKTNTTITNKSSNSNTSISTNTTDNSITEIYKGTSGSYIGKIVIPSIKIYGKDLEYPIMFDATDNNLKENICMLSGSAAFGKGNVIIGGHAMRNGTLFGQLTLISKGEKVYCYDLNNTKYTYQITESKTVTPTDMSDTKQNNKNEITLFTCINSGKERYILRGILINE